MTEIFRRFPQPLEAHIGIVSQIIPFRDYRYMLCKRHNSNVFSSSSSSAFFFFFFFLLLSLLFFFFFLDGTTVQCGSSAFWPVFQICNFACINICLYTIPPSVFGRPLSRLPWGLLLNTWLTFLLPSILLTWPIQFDRPTLTNESIYESPNSCINSLLYRSLQFSLTLIPPFFLRLFFQK